MYMLNYNSSLLILLLQLSLCNPFLFSYGDNHANNQ